MFNPNSINNSEDEHQDNAETEALKTDNMNKKLGDLASSRVLNEKLLHEGVSGNLLKADDETSRDLNLKSLGDYLTNVDLDPNLAEVLLASGVFDVFGHPAAYKVSLWDRKNEDGEPYLTSSIRDELGYSENSGHSYKIFERGNLFVVYDSVAGTSEKRYVMDDPIGSGSSVKYATNLDQVTLVDPDTGKIVALGKCTKNKLADEPAIRSVMNVNNENLNENLKRFDFKIVDQEKFDKLNA